MTLPQGNMSEYRQDPLTGRWVIIGSQRALRPNEFVEAAVREAKKPCPFCAGNEVDTPPAIASYYTQPSDLRKTAAGVVPWQVRVVPNRFPAVTVDTEIAGRTSDPPGFHLLPGFGQHEVVIESPRHVVSWSELTLDEAWCAMRAYRDRLAALKQDGRFAYAQVFKNVGSAAGASIEHTHSQIIAMPWVPEDVVRQLNIAKRHHDRTEQCIGCTVLESEVQARERIVAQTEHFVALCPWASSFAYQVMILPKRHSSSFLSLEDRGIGELANFTRDLVGSIERALGPTAYNWYFHTEPFDTPSPDHYHWHIEIIPRLTKVAGFELATGVFINSVTPEKAADILRTSLRQALNPSPGVSV